MLRETSRRIERRRDVVVALAVLLLAAAPGASAAETIESLRAENAALEAENAALRRRIEALEGKAAPGASDANGASAPLGPGGARTEGVFVPRSRVSVRVARDAKDGSTSLASRWYRTAPGGLLPVKEWMQVRAEQSPAGEITGAWLLIERDGTGASIKSETGRLTIDGRPIEVRLDDYDHSEQRRTSGKVSTMTRRERVRYTIPLAAIGAAARANTAHFEAGSVTFDLTDEQLAAFAAIDVRASAAQPSVKPASTR